MKPNAKTLNTENVFEIYCGLYALRRTVLPSKHSNIPEAKTALCNLPAKHFHCLATISNAFSGLKIILTISILLLITLNLPIPSPSLALEIPKLTRRVNDYADMISDDLEIRLEEKLKHLEQSDSTQVVVLTLPSLEGESLEDYTLRVAQTLGIGQKKYDNGVLLFVSKNDRKIRIEVGYGLEGRLTDILAGRIIDYEMAPYFKQVHFDEGFINGINAIIAEVKGEYKAKGKPIAGRKGNGTGFNPIPLFALIIFISILGKMNRILGGLLGAFLFPLIGWLGLSLGIWIILLLIPIGFSLGLLLPFLPIISFYGRRGRYGGFGGGSGGFGGFSGGGGGFGGGGASGGW